MTEPITTGKTKLRGQIKELEEEITRLKCQPLRKMAEKASRENAALLARIQEIEAVATEAVEVALLLARLVTSDLHTDVRALDDVRPRTNGATSSA